MVERIFDATNARVGRLATVVAKAALLGDKIAVVNSEKAVISGTRERVLAKADQRKKRGIPTKGPFISILPDRYLRRIIRGMLPHKQPKGIVAYKNILCYVGLPEVFKDKKLEKVENADVAALRGTTYITIQEICNELGGK